ncbi:glycoside hydrolase family 20 zincin-like fold domain-containing protein [Thalassobacillus devorans]|uniref:glycoside hydrolase family 20 zincin-like fold domain-containing protein n=1 Tax=Thalassobacillus devorans TaxID=279813 RepID=UPI0020CB25BD|nr:glycoside hydrolase family 20 zincin-like fold domain-containing protein [Thalassobacillus devorans]
MTPVNSWKKMLWLCSIALVCIPLLIGVKQANAESSDDLNINPTPQEINNTGNAFPLTPKVGIVIGEETDKHAVKEVEKALKKAEVKEIIRLEPGDKVNTPVTIWIGGPEENQDSVEVLDNLDVEGPASITDEGYVLVAKETDKKQIVLAGKGKTGTYYAA